MNARQMMSAVARSCAFAVACVATLVGSYMLGTLVVGVLS